MLEKFSESQLDTTLTVCNLPEQEAYEATATILNEDNDVGLENRNPVFLFDPQGTVISMSKNAFNRWLDSVEKDGGFGEIGDF